jgi:hypothetical protein
MGSANTSARGGKGLGKEGGIPEIAMAFPAGGLENGMVGIVGESGKGGNGGGMRKKVLDTAWELAGPVADVRRALVRMRRIKGARFTVDGYSLMEGILLAVFVLLTLSNWPIEILYGTAMATTIVISGLFAYMALLVRSVEDPFKYPSDYFPKPRDGIVACKRAFLFSSMDALRCGSPIDPSILTYLTVTHICFRRPRNAP